MKFILKLKEKEEIKGTEEEKISRLIVENGVEDLTIILEDDEVGDDIIENCYIKIGNIFKNIRISKNNSKILNIDEIINRWSELKREIVFEIEDNSLVNYIFEMSKYYENKECLEFLLNNFSIIPFFRLIDFNELKSNNEDNILEVYTMVPEGKIDYKLEFNLLEEPNGDRKIEFKGNKEPNFDIGELKKAFRKKYDITQDKVFNLNTNIEGNYIFKEKNIEEIEVVLTLDGGKYFKEKYRVSMIRERE